ncbi:MAG TPA: hypothetical protein PKN61_05215 [Acidobacteriota bacterium]|jgi:hypothetical protein|nr:hypothetical protein [Acidobacteriota bacterium]HNR38415.1 hypothetical protein [Acidobacteriota bacterium]HNU01691.1 hypothetical protein [Acidobacteriota bacterium]HPB26644.1 hypothetical protein [Acidobacteriota bacterium]HQO24103.1 hypothetical protein [Acidobacteriota bacterium]
MKLIQCIFAAGLLLMVPSMLVAQQDDTSEKSDVVVVKKTIRFEMMGRQDPFINLDVQKIERQKNAEAQLEPVPSFEERQQQFPGVRGMLIKELALKGIVAKTDGNVAYFEGVDKKAHFIRSGDDLFNAKVKQIKKDGVVFEEFKRYLDKRVEKSVVSVDLHE